VRRESVALSPRVPELVPGVDLRRLPLGPEEGYVLSLINGSRTIDDLALETGLAADLVERTILKLELLGAIVFEGQSSAAASATHEASSPVRAQAPVSGASSSTASDSGRKPVDAGGVDIDPVRQLQILDMYERLDTDTHYQLLGLTPSAEKRTIKAAYFEAVNLFHPDRYFGKSIGPFKPKLERVFARITAAHDTLSRSEARAEYDAYLAAQARTREFEDATSPDSRPPAGLLEQAKREIEEEARRLAALAPDSPTPAPSGSSGTRPAVAAISDAHAQSPASPSAPTARGVSPEERRQAAARKLLSGRSARVSAPPPTSAQGAEAPKERAAREFRARYEDRLRQAKDNQIARYLKAAEEALAVNRAVSASNALRLALSLRPGDAAISALLKTAEDRAQAELSVTYLAQAEYEERTGRLAEACQSYQKAARGQPTAKIFEKVALCALQAGEDLHAAVDFARRAVRAEPESRTYKKTLIQAFLAAGLKQSATAEIERLEALSGADPELKRWLEKAKRGEL
jgi:curved DNA-binding protein CbpA